MKTEIFLPDFSREEIDSNYEMILGRNALYREYGMDRDELMGSIMGLVEPDSSSILEVGTGKGYLTSMLAGLPGHVISADIKNSCNRSAMLSAAYSGRLENVEFIAADAGALSFPDRSFDTVVSALKFHHLDLPFKALREMARVAGRHLVISDFNERGFHVAENIYFSEGSEHERKPADFSIVGIFLREFSFDVTVIEEEWQTIYSAKRK